jgi:hypothetical protein
MPTAVIVDVSASMLRPADPSDPSTTRQDVAQRGILHLLHHLEQHHEFEPVCILSMSSTCRELVPFGRKPSANKQAHKELRTSLYAMEAEDTACVSQALKQACKLLEERYGAVGGCQVVLVVDGGPSLSETNELEMVIPHLPRSVIFHIIAMGSEEELQYCEPYKTLAQASKGSFRDVVLPKDIGFYKRAFANLASSFYQPYRGSLLCGHLEAPIQLYPDPYLALNLSEHQGGAADESRAATTQAAIALRGCIPRDMLVADRADLQANFFKIPVASRHVVIPDKLVADAAAATAAAPALGSAAGSKQPLLPSALMNGLKDAGLVAVCHLDSSLADAAAAASLDGGQRGQEGGSRHKRARGDAGRVGQRAFGGGDCCFLVPLLMPTAAPATGADAGAGSAGDVLQLVVVIPRVGLDTGAPPLHKLVTTKFKDIPALGLGLGQAGSEADAHEGKEKKAKVVHMSKLRGLSA